MQRVMGWRLAVVCLALPCLCAFDGSHAREALDRAFHNLYGADILAGVEMTVRGPRKSSGVRFAFGRKQSGGETRTLVYSASGGRSATRALLFQRPGERDRIFVSDGPHGQVRPMSAGRRGWPLFGTDFSYEDFRAKRADDFRIEVLGSEEVEGEPCRVLRLRPFAGPYTMVLVWLSTSRPVILRSDYFDDRGLWKRLSVPADKVSLQFGWWVPMEDEMLDLRSGSRTLRRIRNLLIDTAVPDELFTTTRLARGRMPKF